MAGVIYSNKIPTYERNAIDFLQELEAPNNNLFFASFIGASFSDTPYRIAGVKVNSPNIAYELNGNKQPSIKSADIEDEVTLTWVEDAYRSVEKFHIDWLNNWYDFNSDFLPIGTNSRFKSIELIGYHYKNIVSNNSTIPIMESEPVIWLRIFNLMPTKFSDNGFNFKWGEASEHTITISYKFSEILPYYYNRQKGQYVLDNEELMNNANNPGFGGARSSDEHCGTVVYEGKPYCDGGSVLHWDSDGKKPFSAWAWHELQNDNGTESIDHQAAFKAKANGEKKPTNEETLSKTSSANSSLDEK